MKNSYQDINQVLHYHGLFFVPKAVWIKLISHHHNNALVSYFDIEKICKLLAKKYYWPSLQHDIEAYIKGCYICLASKRFATSLMVIFSLYQYSPINAKISQKIL